MRVVVVGAGLGGVAAAVGLDRAGHEVTLFERADRLRETGTAILIAPNGVRALDALGLGSYVRGQALRVASGGLRDWRGRPLLVTDLGPAQPTVGTVAMAARRELHQALRAPLRDGQVRTGTPIERLEQDQAGVRVISGGQPVASADAVVVADGASSVHVTPARLGPYSCATASLGRRVSCSAHLRRCLRYWAQAPAICRVGRLSRLNRLVVPISRSRAASAFSRCGPG